VVRSKSKRKVPFNDAMQAQRKTEAVKLGMLSESIGCALGVTMRARIDATEISTAALREIDKARVHLQRAGLIVNKDIDAL
jgi:hypothetical protein